MNLNFNSMKTINFKIFASSILVCLAMVACVQDDDFTVPSSVGSEENDNLNALLQSIDQNAVQLVSVEYVKGLYNGQVTLIESDIAVKGYVSSSDATGNFYKEFYLQDAPENPTAGIGIYLNQVDSYNQFNIGREVYINLKGLYVGENASEVITIGGSADGSRVGIINASQIPSFILRSETTETMVPLVVNVSNVDDSHMGLLVSFEDVQFPLGLAGQSYVDPYDDYDTLYPLVSCLNGAEFFVETSSFASFNQEPLPTDGRGTITGLISKSYGGDDRVMMLNSTDDVLFNDARCDPVFEESFNSATDNTNLNIANWINYAEAGTELWTEQVYGGNGYAEFSAYATGESSNIGWLISPGIDMDAQDGEVLNFQTEYAYPDTGHYPLEVLVSTDFNGEESGIATATWEPLTVVIAHPDVTSDWFSWVDSGAVDLSSYTGTLYVAFKYTGSDTSNQNSTIHVENVIVSVP
jgi:hypothetical protein|tara:strand:- start:1057 stop:2460 length:1404 start_codon:yes stop_codon:yes gene_type:complete